MTLKIVALINIIISAIVGGMYWGPWLALTRSLKSFDAKVFLVIVKRLNQNMAPLMTVLSPLSLLTTILVLIISYNNQIATFYFTLVGFVLFLIALIVTVAIEVPIVKQIVTWTESTLPANWEQQRDRWAKFHLIRVISGIVGLIFLLAGILFGA
ncbi:MAG: DUF1772 domain-containing protein [Bacteroidetes bacterium]|nr:DUF1772 domain-containing protein [Bacteroidota bacterium]